MLNDLIIRSAGLGLLRRFPDQPFPHNLTPELIDGICRSIYLRNGLFYLREDDVRDLPVMSAFYAIIDAQENDELVFAAIVVAFGRYEFTGSQSEYWYARVRGRYLTLWSSGQSKVIMARLGQKYFPHAYSPGKTYSNGTTLQSDEVIPFALELKESGLC